MPFSAKIRGKRRGSCGPNGRREEAMAFTKLSIEAAGADATRGSFPPSETDVWTIFRALRDARSVFGLRPGHIQTLQAMLSFLKPGHAKRFLRLTIHFASALAESTNGHSGGTSTASLNSDSSSAMTARTESATAFAHPAGSASVMDCLSPPCSNVRASL